MNGVAFEIAGDTLILIDAMTGETGTAMNLLGSEGLRRTLETYLSAAKKLKETENE